MTPKQKRFIDEYMVDCNATQAAVRAGYSEKTAYAIGEQNLRKLEIRTAIEKARQDQQARTELTADQVVRGLLAEAQRDGEGSSHGARVAAWTTLAKHLGMLTPELQITQMPYEQALRELYESRPLDEADEAAPVH